MQFTVREKSDMNVNRAQKRAWSKDETSLGLIAVEKLIKTDQIHRKNYIPFC